MFYVCRVFWQGVLGCCQKVVKYPELNGMPTRCWYLFGSRCGCRSVRCPRAFVVSSRHRSEVFSSSMYLDSSVIALLCFCFASNVLPLLVPVGGYVKYATMRC